MTDLIWEAKCCRVWPVRALAPMGKCGYCNTRPEPTGRLWDEANNTGVEKDVR